VRAFPFSVTAPIIYLGTALLTWWLMGVLSGPAGYRPIAWLTSSTGGLSILTVYLVAAAVQSVVTMRMMTRLTSRIRYEGIGAFAALLLTIGMGLFLANVADRNHAAVFFMVMSPAAASLVLLFMLSAAVQMAWGMNHVIDAALPAPARRVARIVNIVCATAIVAISVLTTAFVAWRVATGA
jgi:succinate dehydrogenase hydrophobic anchor subunit